MARHTRRLAEPPIDLFDYRQDQPCTLRPAKPTDVSIAVSDDWPTSVPITDHEARVIEAFFADVLDELFGPLP